MKGPKIEGKGRLISDILWGTHQAINTMAWQEECITYFPNVLAQGRNHHYHDWKKALLLHQVNAPAVIMFCIKIQVMNLLRKWAVLLRLQPASLKRI